MKFLQARGLQGEEQVTLQEKGVRRLVADSGQAREGKAALQATLCVHVAQQAEYPLVEQQGCSQGGHGRWRR